MEPLIADSVSRLLLKFEKAADSGKSVDVFEYFGRYTMEVILASAFGRYKDIQSTEERDKLTDSADAIFGATREKSMLDAFMLLKWLCECAYLHLCCVLLSLHLLYLLCNCCAVFGCVLPAIFPWLEHVLPYFIRNTKPAQAWLYLEQAASKLVKQRRVEGNSGHVSP